MSKGERVVLVDEHDTIIGEKWRDQLTDNDCWRIAAVWVENSKGQVLIQKRSRNRVMNPGLWTAAAVGTVPKSHSYEETARRELKEELGVSDAVLEFRAKAYYRASVGSRQIQTYGCIIDKEVDEFIIQKEEVDQIRWIEPGDLRDELQEHPERFSKPNLWEKVYAFKTS